MPEWLYWAILVFATLPLHLLAGWAIFDDLDGFYDSIVYFFKKDIKSYLKGEGVEDGWAELMLLIWLLMCAGFVFLAHHVTQNYIIG
ncbi:MAG: hypothetical protein KC996_11870 [Phycisphaerales bacterium]|nr:hypothetical protein [Phycisphaerales bacterium]